jgi:hypothetical protein
MNDLGRDGVPKSLWHARLQTTDLVDPLKSDCESPKSVILAAWIRNMSESKAKLLTIEEVATPLKLPSSGGGVIVSSSGTTLRHRRKPTFAADIFRFFCLSIDRGSFAGCTSTSPGARTRHGERGMKDTDHFLTDVPFTSAVNGSIEEH